MFFIQLNNTNRVLKTSRKEVLNMYEFSRRAFLRLLGKITAALGMLFSLGAGCAKEEPEVKPEVIEEDRREGGNFGNVTIEEINLGTGNMKGALSLYFRYPSLSLLLIFISSTKAIQIMTKDVINQGKLAPGFLPPRGTGESPAISITP